MRALPFACVRAGERIARIEAPEAVDRLVEEGSYLRDGQPSYFVWQVFSEATGPRQGLLCACAVGEFAGAVADAAADPDVPAHLLGLGYQDAPVALERPAEPVLAMIMGTATTGTPVYEFKIGDETQTLWAIKRGEALDALHELLGRLDAGSVRVVEPAHLAGTVEAARALRDEAKATGAYTGREPFNWFTAALFTADALAAGVPRLPAGLILRPLR